VGVEDKGGVCGGNEADDGELNHEDMAHVGCGQVALGKDTTSMSTCTCLSMLMGISMVTFPTYPRVEWMLWSCGNAGLLRLPIPPG
jgi:hypothetical protein